MLLDSVFGFVRKLAKAAFERLVDRRRRLRLLLLHLDLRRGRLHLRDLEDPKRSTKASCCSTEVEHIPQEQKFEVIGSNPRPPSAGLLLLSSK